jgi:hypothetical protein
MGGAVIRRKYFGWFKDDAFFFSHQPPDAPVRPCAKYQSIDEVKALLRRRGVEVFWWPPLPDDIHAEIQKGLRVEG